MNKRFVPEKQLPEIKNLNEDRYPNDDDFKSEVIILLVHGFASHTSNMEKMIDYFKNQKYMVLGFNYRSYIDIHQSATALDSLLSKIIPSTFDFKKKYIFAIGHSQGGLVLRDFVLQCNGDRYLSCVFMLGTPNNSTLNNELIKYLIRHVEFISFFVQPKFAIAASQDAVKQLTKTDNNPDGHFIDCLNLLERDSAKEIPYITIAAGGGPNLNLRIAKRKFFQRYLNQKIQLMLGDDRNDGLVVEPSVNIRDFINFSFPRSSINHFNDSHYEDFKYLDHSGLIESHEVFCLIHNFINDHLDKLIEY